MHQAWSRRSRIYGLCAAVFLAFFVAWEAGRWGGPNGAAVFSDLLLPPAVGTGAGVCMWVGRRMQDSRRRTGWTLIGVALASWSVGAATWSYYELVLHREAPFLSWADVGYLGLVPFALVGLALLRTHPQAWPARFRTALDGAILGISLLVVSWPIVLGPALRTAAAGPWAGALAVAHPLGAVMLITRAIATFLRAGRQGREPAAWVLAGFAFVALSDGASTYLNAVHAYTSGHVVSGGWLAGFALIALGALRSLDVPPPGALPQHAHAFWFGALPLVPFALALAVVVAEQVRRGTIEPLVFWLTFLVLALVLVRGLVLLRENEGWARRTQDAYDALKASEARRTQMTHMVAHDIGTPLTPILIQIHLLRNASGQSAEARDHALEIIDRNLAQVRALVNDFLDVSRIESGQLKLQAAPVDLADVVNRAAESLMDVARERHLDLDVRLDETLPAVADPARINQVMNNLLTNAFKFTPAGGHVWVTGLRLAGRARVAVRDSGRGLAADEIPKLFKPFSQVHDPREVKERGTGLGLFICKGIVEAQGGRIWAESPGHGHGSTFTWDLPLA